MFLGGVANDHVTTIVYGPALLSHALIGAGFNEGTLIGDIAG